MATTYRVCPQCRGEGKMVNRAVSFWTQDDIEQDPEAFRAMIEGHYDVPCDRCNGLRVVTRKNDREYAEQRRDHREYLMESGIYPGSRDFF